MGKIRNSVYGLALGDAKAYPTEFKSFNDAVEHAKKDDGRSELLVSDDTQMSIALIQGVENTLSAYRASQKPEEIRSVGKETFFQKFINSFKQPTQHPETYEDLAAPTEPRSLEFIPGIANQFISWSTSSENSRAPGIACMEALKSLRQTKPLGGNTSLSQWLGGSILNSNSKGSGTVMRSPWTAFLQTGGLIESENLRAFSIAQSRITHGHDTALEASYLTALITRELYTGALDINNVVHFAEQAISHARQEDGNTGWDELNDIIQKILVTGRSFGKTKRYDRDPSSYIGSAGTADCVLGTALFLIHNFPQDPMEVLERSVATLGDSDTIAAVAGGIVGAAFEGDIWGEESNRVEKAYVERLDQVVLFLEEINENRE